MTYWKNQERRIKAILKQRGWQRTLRNPSSGALPIAIFKNDVTGSWPPNNSTISIDHKSTKGRETIQLKRTDLEKAIANARATNAIGIVTWNYYYQPTIYAALPFDDLLVLLERADYEAIAEIIIR